MTGCLLVHVHGHLNYLSRGQHRLVDFGLLLRYSSLDLQEHVKLSQLVLHSQEWGKRGCSNSAPFFRPHDPSDFIIESSSKMTSLLIVIFLVTGFQICN
jgi:hypothetical protein